MEAQRWEWQQTSPWKLCKSGDNGVTPWKGWRGEMLIPPAFCTRQHLSEIQGDKGFSTNGNLKKNYCQQTCMSRNDRGRFQADGMIYQQTLWSTQKMKNTGNDWKSWINANITHFLFLIALKYYSVSKVKVVAAYCVFIECAEVNWQRCRTGGGSWVYTVGECDKF